MLKLDADFLFSYTWLATVAYFIEVPLIHSELLGSIIWIPAVLLSFLYCIINIKQIDQNQVLKCLILLLIMICSLLLDGNLFSKSRYVSILCFLNSLLAICVFSSDCISKRTMRLVENSCCFIAVLFIIYYQTPIAHKTINDGITWVCKDLTFNLDNSNMAGIFLYLIFSMLFIFYCKEKRLVKKFFLLGLMGSTLFFIYGTGTRSCMIAVVATLLLGIMSKIIHTIPRIVIWFSMLFPVAFIVGIVNLYNSGYANLEILGKRIFTGRETAFVDMLKTIDTFSKKLLGDFSLWGLNNAHNAPLAIYLSTGVIGLILVYSIYYKAIKHMNSSRFLQNRIGIICVSCVLGLFVESCAEAALFMGGFPVVNFVATLFVIASTEVNEDCMEEYYYEE